MLEHSLIYFQQPFGRGRTALLSSELRRFDAIRRDEGGVFFRGQREAGRGDLLAGLLLLGAGVVEGEEVGEDVVVLAHAVGGL